MSNRLIVYLAGLGIVGIIILLALNTASMLGVTGDRYISANDVRGMALEARGKTWTLNFEQQKEVIDILNQSKPMQAPTYKQLEFVSNPGFERIIIYRFLDQPDLILSPIGYVNTQVPGQENLEFTVPGWNPNGNLRETSDGKLKSILESVYDKPRQ